MVPGGPSLRALAAELIELAGATLGADDCDFGMVEDLHTVRSLIDGST